MGGYTVTVIMEDGRMSTRGEAMKGSEVSGEEVSIHIPGRWAVVGPLVSYCIATYGC